MTEIKEKTRGVIVFGTPKIFEKLRCWIDGETEENMELIQKSNEPRKSEDFLKKVALSLDSVLQDEIFVPPNREAQIPNKFVVYLNPADNLLWQNTKRLALEQTLSELIYERAIELAETSNLSTKKIEVNLRCDHNLAHPMFQVVAFWEDSKNILPPVEEATIFISDSQSSVLFRAKIWKGDTFQKEASFSNNCATIGRGSTQLKTDIILDDLSISRTQAKIIYLGRKTFFLTNEGLNSIQVGERLLKHHNSIKFDSNETISIGDYKIQFFAVDETAFFPDNTSLNPFATTQN